MSERITKEVRVNRKDDPGIVAEQFAEILNEFGIQCVNTTPDSEETFVYKIEVDVEVMEFDPDEHHSMGEEQSDAWGKVIDNLSKELTEAHHCHDSNCKH